jgi:cytochrome bd-type quinol oxidase subunit 2
MTLKKKFIKLLQKNKLLTVALTATIPSVFLWFSATLSYLYISYIGPFIFKLSNVGEIFVFLLLPIVGLVSSFLVRKKNPRKLTAFLLATNTILLLFVLIFSYLFS